jgi:hypothetical protein
VLAFSRRLDSEICRILINMTDEQVVLDESLMPAGSTVMLASDLVDPTGLPAQLGPDQALILSV